MAINRDPFDHVSRLVFQHAGIRLDDSKRYLMDSRLFPLARALGMTSLDQLFEEMFRNPDQTLDLQIVDSMTNHETSFFRDHYPFLELKKMLAARWSSPTNPPTPVSIWSAACSGGQEPYSIALMIREHFPWISRTHLRLVASDFSPAQVRRAREAIYTQLEVNRGLPSSQLVRHFDKHGVCWQLESKIRSLVEFQVLNLTHPWPWLEKFDFIFLRNVLIYFDNDSKRDILEKARQHLKPDGLLCLGAGETTLNFHPGFEPVHFEQCSFYKIR